MITHALPLERINKAFDLMHAGKSIRSVVVSEAPGACHPGRREAAIRDARLTCPQVRSPPGRTGPSAAIAQGRAA